MLIFVRTKLSFTEKYPPINYRLAHRIFSNDFWLLVTLSVNLYRVPWELTHSAASKVGQNKLYLPIPDSASCVMAEINKSPKQSQTGMVGKDLYWWTDGEMIEKEKEKNGWRGRKNWTEAESGKSRGTCAAVSLSFNPLGFFLPPFPTFSVLIDKHREGTGPRD